MLRPEEVLQLLPASFAEVEAAESKLACVIDELKTESHFLKGVVDGTYSGTKLNHNGQDAYIFIWQKQPGNRLHVCASLFIGSGNDDSAIWGKAAEMIARTQGCSKITFHTKRLGHIIQGQTWGAVITGVEMTKVLSNE